MSELELIRFETQSYTATVAKPVEIEPFRSAGFGAAAAPKHHSSYSRTAGCHGSKRGCLQKISTFHDLTSNFIIRFRHSEHKRKIFVPKHKVNAFRYICKHKHSRL
jgi:hypothetical protein